MMATGDRTGWKRGAGPYSKNYAKPETAGEFKLYADPARPQKRGKDVAGKITEAADRNDGYSAEVSSGKRPTYNRGNW